MSLRLSAGAEGEGKGGSEERMKTGLQDVSTQMKRRGILLRCSLGRIPSDDSLRNYDFARNLYELSLRDNSEPKNWIDRVPQSGRRDGNRFALLVAPSSSLTSSRRLSRLVEESTFRYGGSRRFRSAVRSTRENRFTVPSDSLSARPRERLLKMLIDRLAFRRRVRFYSACGFRSRWRKITAPFASRR